MVSLILMSIVEWLTSTAPGVALLGWFVVLPVTGLLYLVGVLK